MATNSSKRKLCELGDDCGRYLQGTCPFYHAPTLYHSPKPSKRRRRRVKQTQDKKEQETEKVSIKPDFDVEEESDDLHGELRIILKDKGFPKKIIDRACSEYKNYIHGQKGDLLDIILKKCELFQKNSGRRGNKKRKNHLKNWKNWSCEEVNEWIESRFKSERYAKWRETMAKEFKVKGSQIKDFNHLSLDLLGLHNRKDRVTVIQAVRNLKEGKQGNGNDSTIPEQFLDPLTFQLMKDPVICRSGITYDRQSILRHIKSRGPMDPFTSQRVFVSELIPNMAVRNLITRWKKGNDQTRSV